MSTSTDGQICYGISLEGIEFPWDGIEKWWQEVNGFKHSIEIYSETDGGGYVGGKKPAESVINSYYEEEKKWLEANPLPVEVVNYCSIDYPSYMLAVPESFKSCGRGYPLEFDPAELKVTDGQHQKLVDFCLKYLGKEIEAHNAEEYNDKKIVLDPKWYLTSYWG